MRRTGFIPIVMGCLWGTCTLHAQEGPVIPSFRADSMMRGLPIAPPVQLSTYWLKEKLNPIYRQRREIHNAMWQRARQSVIQLPQPAVQHDPNKEVGLWRMSVGNTSVNNWSPYPDRALDARTLRFPLPRGLQPDKRP